MNLKSILLLTLFWSNAFADEYIVEAFSNIPAVYDPVMEAVINPDTGELLCVENCETFVANIEKPKSDYYNPYADPNNCVRIAKEIDLRNAEQAYSVPLLIIDKERSYIFSGNVSYPEEYETTINFVTLQKYSRLHCNRLKPSNKHIVANVIIGDRVETYSGFEAIDETFPSVIIVIVSQL